jgi:hypothetical protein
MDEKQEKVRAQALAFLYLTMEQTGLRAIPAQP